MPKSFDKSALGFSSGKKGTVNSSNVTYNVNGNVISGTVKSPLKSRQGLTVRLTLPEGYFVGAKTNIDISCIIIMIFSLTCVLISYILWSKYGKDEKVIETVEFYPPKGYNSAEIGLMYKGNVDNEGVISLLVYLANQGYLKIEETEQQGLLKKVKGFKITKLKEYDGTNENEKIFFNGLFKTNKSLDMNKAREIMKEAKSYGEKISFIQAIELATDISETTSVTDTDLYNSFYSTLNKIKNNLNSKENKNKIFESYASGMKKYLILMTAIIFGLITIKTTMDYYGELLVGIVTIIFTGIGFTIFVEAMIGTIKVPKVFLVIWCSMFSGMPWIAAVLPALIQNVSLMIMYIVGIGCIVAIIAFRKIMPKRTPFGNEMLGKIEGFKKFLETAEKQKLEMLVSQNPQYFYSILPYSYALGVSDVWIKQFETIAIQAPSWYSGSDHFDTHSFATFMTSTMSKATSAMSSRSSSGGGSSGGGSSGGGSGGGGGGSW